MDTKILRNAIFSLHTRKFGSVVEILVERILQEFGFIISKSDNGSYDRQVNNEKDEIKGSRVLGKSILDLKSDNIIESLLKQETFRFVDIQNTNNVDWDCNIQQIKTHFFRTLWYVLFFKECVAIFKITNDQILEDKNISYSNKQHRGNENEGQFHVTNKNLKYHMEKYLVKKITYDEVFEKLSKKTKISTN